MLIRLGITRLSMIPLEIARECFLSPLRSEIAAALRRKGWSQGEIAKVLGVTQVAGQQAPPRGEER
jgi:predicted XRE-type DNA-binding protein